MLGSSELGWKHEIHIVKQCLKIEVLTEGQIFNKHKTGHTLKIFEKTRRGVQKKISMFSQSYLVAVLVWELLCISLWVEQISDHVFHQEKEDRGVRSVGLYKKS